MTTLSLPGKQIQPKPCSTDCLPDSVASQVAKGKVVTYNQGRRLVTARKVRHLVVLSSA